MAYVSVADFKFGMDRRRPRAAGVPGTLWIGKNVHISRGGDIERAKKFVPVLTLPVGTFGLFQIRGQLITFGSADLAASMPAGITYRRLASPTGSAMTRVLSVTAFGGAEHAIAEYADGQILHWHGVVLITQIATATAANSSFASLADYLAWKVNADPAVDAVALGGVIYITASVPGTAFSMNVSAANMAGGVNDQTLAPATLQVNVAAVAEVRATGTVTITGGTRSPGVNLVSQLTLNGVSIIGAPVDWISSNSATAVALAVMINNGTSATGASASALGNVVTIKAPVGSGTSYNGWALVVTNGGDVSTTTSGTMSGGVAAVAPVAQVFTATFGGTYENLDTFIIQINGAAAYSATGRASGVLTQWLAYKKRIYGVANTLLFYSKIGDAENWTDVAPASGAGFIDVSSDFSSSQRLVAAVPYQTFLAIFARQSISVYDIKTDATLSEFRQTIYNTGAVSSRSVISYGNTDVFYLDDTGIRSLQVRDLTNQAAVSDAGSAIDTFVTEHIATISEDTVERAISVIDPIDGRLMMAIGPRIFVLSHFVSSKIKAWSYYEPGFTATDLLRVNRRIYARDATTVYLYGGVSGQVYPSAGEMIAEAHLPFLTAQEPATFKQWQGFDLVCEGVWSVDMLVDPTDETKIVHGGIVTKTTNHLPAQALVGASPMFAPKFTCSAAGPAKISSFIAHYDKLQAD